MSEESSDRSVQPGLAARSFLLAFDRVVRALFRIEESGLPARVPARCLIVANHRRDADIPILGAFLGRARGTRITGVLPHFVAREDLFDPGFLWNYWRSPWLVLPRLVSPAIPLARILKVFKAHPIHRIPEQSLGIVLGDVRRYLGEHRLGEVLNPRWAARLEAAGADLSQPISRLLRRAREFEPLIGGGWGHRRLNRQTFRRLKPIERARIAAHLAVFTDALANGEAVMLAPEGANSPDGHFQRPRAGAWRIAHDAGPDLPVLPVGLAYDPSIGGARMRVFVHAGQTFAAGDYPRRREFDDAVATAVLRATTVTGSHLAAHLVLRADSGESLTPATLEALNASLGAALAASGLRVAPDAAAVAERRFTWFERAGLLERQDGDWRRSHRPVPAPGWGNHAALAVYLRNELASVASLAPAVAAAHGLAPPPWAPRSE
ncbi:MAG: lysophospholipid acyltransferase family protein [Gammaproteobacteria bacterium]